MMDLLTSAMDAGAALAETFSKPVNTGASFTRYGTVVKNNGTTLDVELCGATLAAVPMLTTCAGAKAGDRCLLTVDGPLVTVTGILANADNTHYVNGNCDIFIGSETVRINNHSWYDWLTKSQQVTKFGRSFNQNTDFFTVMNANVGLANYGLVASYANEAGQLGFSISKAFTGSLKFNWLVVMAR